MRQNVRTQILETPLDDEDVGGLPQACCEPLGGEGELRGKERARRGRAKCFLLDSTSRGLPSQVVLEYLLYRGYCKSAAKLGDALQSPLGLTGASVQARKGRRRRGHRVFAPTADGLDQPGLTTVTAFPLFFFFLLL